MPRPAASQPTDVELQILRILWEQGPSPVRTIHARLKADKGTNYSTTVKMLAIMLDKGLVVRDEQTRPHIYRAAMSQQRAQKRMLSDMLAKLYDGSAKTLVMQALSAGRATPAELQEIRQLLDELEGNR